LATDVAGYSRLIGADESGTLQALKAIRAELIDPTIASHNGRLVKTTGDGLLVEFASVVDALRCATEVQVGMVERNATAPADKRIEFRIHFVARISSWARSAPGIYFHERRMYSGRPSPSMRFNEATAMATSVVCRRSVRARSASPITRL